MATKSWKQQVIEEGAVIAFGSALLIVLAILVATLFFTNDVQKQ